MRARPARCVVLAVLLAAGCSDTESIRVLDESKSGRPPVAPVPADQKQYRTLAAMVPADTGEAGGQNWWFFKLSGKADVVAEFEPSFNKLLDSVRAEADEKKPITWTLPPGWTEGDGNTMRYATLKAPGGAAEVAVSRAGGILQMNVQRWWGQLWGKDKEDQVTAANLSDYVRQRVVNGRLIFLVDMSGPKDPNANAAKMMNPHGGQ